MRIAPLFRLPIFRSLLGSSVVALGVGAFLTTSEPEPMSTVVIEHPMIELALDLQVEEAQAGCMYYSSFDTDVVGVEPDQASKELHRSFSFMDGCEWESTERLERESDGRYRYTYTEHVVSCPPEANPSSACTRSGYAVAHATR